MRLPAGLFLAMKDNETARDVAGKSFLPEGMDPILETVVKRSLGTRKVC